MVAWLVAALVIVINGHLLPDFFSSEVNNGVLFSTIVCGFTALYVAFIVSWGVTFSNWCRRSKSVAETGN